MHIACRLSGDIPVGAPRITECPLEPQQPNIKAKGTTALQPDSVYFYRSTDWASPKFTQSLPDRRRVKGRGIADPESLAAYPSK
jgi:hypothetical protein